MIAKWVEAEYPGFLCERTVHFQGCKTGDFAGVPLTGFLPLMGKYPWITFDKLLPEYPELLEVNLGEPVVIIQDYETLEKAFVDQGQAFTGRPPQFVTDYFSSGTDGQVRGKASKSAIPLTIVTDRWPIDPVMSPWHSYLELPISMDLAGARVVNGAC